MGLLLLFIETLVAHIGAAFGPGLVSATLLAGNRRLRLLGPALGRPAFWLVFSLPKQLTENPRLGCWGWSGCVHDRASRPGDPSRLGRSQPWNRGLSSWELGCGGCRLGQLSLGCSQVGSAELRLGGCGGRSGRCGYLAGVGHAKIALFDTGGLLIGSGISFRDGLRLGVGASRRLRQAVLGAGADVGLLQLALHGRSLRGRGWDRGAHIGAARRLGRRRGGCLVHGMKSGLGLCVNPRAVDHLNRLGIGLVFGRVVGVFLVLVATYNLATAVDQIVIVGVGLLQIGPRKNDPTRPCGFTGLSGLVDVNRLLVLRALGTSHGVVVLLVSLGVDQLGLLGCQNGLVLLLADSVVRTCGSRSHLLVAMNDHLIDGLVHVLGLLGRLAGRHLTAFLQTVGLAAFLAQLFLGHVLGLVHALAIHLPGRYILNTGAGLCGLIVLVVGDERLFQLASTQRLNFLGVKVDFLTSSLDENFSGFLWGVHFVVSHGFFSFSLGKDYCRRLRLQGCLWNQVV